MSARTLEPRPIWGLWGLALGAAALVIVALQMSAIFSAPAPDPGTVIGEIAAEMRQSATRALLGQVPPEPQAKPWSVMDFLILLAPVLAGLATLIGGISLYRREAPRLATIAITLGVSAFVMQYVFWLAIAICGILLLTAIVTNLESILGG